MRIKNFGTENSIDNLRAKLRKHEAVYHQKPVVEESEAGNFCVYGLKTGQFISCDPDDIEDFIEDLKISAKLLKKFAKETS